MTLTGEDFIRCCDDLRKRISGRRVQTPVAMMPLSLPDLPDSWCWTSLSSLCERVSVGHVGPTTEFFCDAPAGIPFIRSQDVRPGKLTLANVAHVVQTFHDKLKKSQLKSGDILIVRVGANRGDCCVVPDGVGSLNCANIVFARPMVPNPFLGFFFNSAFGQSLLSSLTTGSAQGVLNTQSIAMVPVPVPPIHLQRKIASILSAYDDLIENNTRRIAILEEMAQAIYREWFVNFRFPGHENVKLVDSPRGQIPEGWEVVTLKDVCVEKKGIQTGPFGSQLHQSDYTDNGTPVVMPKDIFDARISTDSIARVPDEVCNRLLRHRLEVGDTVCARRGEIGRNAFVTDRESQWMCGTGCMRLRPLKTVISPRLLFDYLCTPDIVSLIAGKAAGAIMPNLNIGIMESVPILLPPESVQLSYESFALENLTLVSTLVSKNRNLRITRDLLLPKLISGQLDVEDLDIDVGMTAEELTDAAAG